MPHNIISNVVLVIASCTLCYVSLLDLKENKIPNWSTLLLIGLFLAHAFISGRWVSIYLNLGLASIVFVFSILFYSRDLMGGGDVKILTVAFLWVGIDCALPLAVLIMIFVTIHTGIAKLGWKVARPFEGRMRIAFAPSVGAALVCTFIMGCLRALPNGS
jgi:prepilin peptidase CpaA